MATFQGGWVKIAACAIAVVGAMAPAQAEEEASLRAEKWEISGAVIYALEADITGELGTSATVEDDLGFGFAAGYNFNRYFQLGGNFNWDSRDYQTTGAVGDGSLLGYENELESTTFGLYGLWFILPGNVTPYLSANLGYTYVDSNIQDGPTETVVYYDPWWGYTYDTYTPTRSESGLSYGAGVGLRVDINEFFSLQISYNMTWLDLGGAVENPNLDSIRIEFIGRTF